MADIQGASDFLRFLVSSLVENGDSVVIDPQDSGKHTTLELTLNPTDLPTITANDGELADMLHTALDAYSYKHRIRTRLHIIGADDDSDYSDGSQADTPV